MKESILDVLLYLFEHYFSEDADPVRDRDSLQNGLIQAGFSPTEISKAFDWLDALADQRPAVAQPRIDGPIRIYHGPELDKLDVECRGFLLFLEQHGILDSDQRELVLDPGHGPGPGRAGPGRPEMGGADGAVQPARRRGGIRVDGNADVRRRAGTGPLSH
ncbi:hypothetical protein QE400_001209 [Xanthomonas sacchari]|nr:hypothetical protein [Xanthomonas sacchari]